MPLQYSGIMKEHKAVRSSLGIFDVSHMGQIWVRGAGALAAVQRLITNDASKLTDHQAQYTVLCNPAGGIVDDCIVYRLGANELLIVVNAANISTDRAWIEEVIGKDAQVVDESEETALVAVQGPDARQAVAKIGSSNLMDIKPFHTGNEKIAGIDCFVARTGYTGEDGFEISCKSESAVSLWDALLEAGAVPIGLGARDTLRLEAKLCLYGNDIDTTTSPYEAGLGWVVKPAAKDFIGKEALLEQKKAGLARKLVGFRIEGRGVPRPGYTIVDRALPDPVIGKVTSGTTGITVGGGIGMGYVPASHSAPGSTLTVDCRGKDVPAVVVKGAFYKRS